MHQNTIYERVQRINVLPTFSYVVGEVMSIIENPMSSASDLARHMDPSMVGEVMRIANTAYFGTRNFGNIGTIEQAIAVIGLQHLSHVLLHMPFLSMVANGKFDRKSFIGHSIACGVMSKAVSTISRRGEPNEVYVAGIVHDIGVIIMYQYFKKEWEEIGTIMEGKGLSRVEAEREVLTVDHGHMGALLLERWNIPRAITEAVRFHHCPLESEETSENALVLNIGNRLVKRVDFKNDFASFDDFMARHRDFTEELLELGKRFSASTEIEFFEESYKILGNVKKYVEGVIEDADGDKSSCC